MILNNVSFSMTSAESEILLELCKRYNVTRGEIIRKAIDIAAAKRDLMKKYIIRRNEENDVFNSDTDSYNSKKFCYTIIDPIKNLLKVSILINFDNCRITLSKRTQATIESTHGDTFIIFMYSKKGNSALFKVKLNLADIKDVKIWNIYSGTEMDYKYISVEEMADHECLELVCQGGKYGYN